MTIRGKGYWFAGACLVGVMAVGGGFAMWTNSPTQRAKEAVTKNLKDPESAVFSDLETCGQHGDAFVTGMINSKNSYGAMAGRVRFVAVVTAKSVLAEMDSEGEDDQNTAHAYQARINDESFRKSTCWNRYEIADKASSAALNTYITRREAEIKEQRIMDAAIEDIEAVADKMLK